MPPSTATPPPSSSLYLVRPCEMARGNGLTLAALRLDDASTNVLLDVLDVAQAERYGYNQAPYKVSRGMDKMKVRFRVLEPRENNKEKEHSLFNSREDVVLESLRGLRAKKVENLSLQVDFSMGGGLSINQYDTFRAWRIMVVKLEDLLPLHVMLKPTDTERFQTLAQRVPAEALRLLLPVEDVEKGERIEKYPRERKLLLQQSLKKEDLLAAFASEHAPLREVAMRFWSGMNTPEAAEEMRAQARKVR